MRNLEQQLSPDNPENNKDVYLQDLVIETTAETEPRHFDPERDITEEEWKKVQKELTTHKIALIWGDRAAIKHGVNMHILDKKKVLFTEHDWHAIEDKSLASGDNEYLTTINVARLAILDRESKIPTEEDWEKMELALQGCGEKGSHYAEIAALISILDPEKVKPTEEDWKGMRKELKRQRTLTHFSKGGLAEHASNMSILDRERVHLTSKDWERMHNELEKDRASGNWIGFTEQAAHLHILSADEIKVSKEKGLELIFNDKPKEDFNTDTPLPPEKRV